RRKFVVALAGAAAWPLAARAQQGNRVRRIGVLMGGDENDPLAKLRYSAFRQALAYLGWTEGRNVQMGLRSYGDDINRIRALARNDSEDHDRFSISALCHDLFHPIAPLERLLILTANRRFRHIAKSVQHGSYPRRIPSTAAPRRHPAGGQLSGDHSETAG